MDRIIDQYLELVLSLKLNSKKTYLFTESWLDDGHFSSLDDH